MLQVSDFGLAREMELVNRIETATYGTVTHMPPVSHCKRACCWG